jgi:glycosyltransferase involved in cell wall biosynthesis
MILLAHPTGNTFSRALLDRLLERDQLGLFATTIALNGREPWLNMLPKAMRAELLRRWFEVPDNKLLSRPLREILRLTRGRFGLNSDVNRVYRDLDRKIAGILSELIGRHHLTGVYAYEDGAGEMFSAASMAGLKCFYELPIAYWETAQRLLRAEAERWPQWERTIPMLEDSPEKQARKTQEVQLADVIFCPSRFVYDSIPPSVRNTRRCVVAEFGSPAARRPQEFRRAGKKIRVLFAGAMTQRKGLADLFAAMKLLKADHFELVVMGSLMAPMEFYRKEFPDFVYEPSRPHEKVLELMETCDVLVMPSIVEGRALVQQEAMSRGVILISTANAGAADLVEDGTAGFLVPVRSPGEIAEKLTWIAEHRAALPEMKRAAYEKAAALTWKSYADRIIDAFAGE